MSNNTFLVVSSKPWAFNLERAIKAKTGGEVVLISDREQFTFENLSRLSPRYVFIPHWSFIIPKEIFETFECVIFHMTDLPFGRGGSPLQNLIQRGHTETKISAFRCVAQLDAGPVYMKRSLSLEGSASEIFSRAARIIESMIEEILDTEPEPIPQKGESVVFRRRTPGQSNLREACISNLKDFFDFIRMLDAPTYPLAFIEHGDFQIEFSHARLLDNCIEARVTIRHKDDL
jgi:methionyl-tRNA formyltransferase